MAIWTVLTRDAAADTAAEAAARTVFVKESFSVLALLFAPLVLLWFGLWLTFAAYAAVAALMAVSTDLFGLPDEIPVLVMAGFNLLLAFELAALRVRKLARGGWREAAVIVAPDREAAEHRFFSGWVERRSAPPQPAPRPQRARAFAPPAAGTGIIGSFPGSAGG